MYLEFYTLLCKPLRLLIGTTQEKKECIMEKAFRQEEDWLRVERSLEFHCCPPPKSVSPSLCAYAAENGCFCPV